MEVSEKIEVPPVFIQILVGFSLKKTIQLLGYPPFTTPHVLLGGPQGDQLNPTTVTERRNDAGRARLLQRILRAEHVGVARLSRGHNPPRAS